eukprot:364595-Chlamydomonas_euryale.AAC.11
MAAAHISCHATACTCGAGAHNHRRCRLTNVPVARQSTSATACGHHQKAWSCQTSGVNGCSAGVTQLHGHLHVLAVS